MIMREGWALWLWAGSPPDAASCITPRSTRKNRVFIAVVPVDQPLVSYSFFQGRMPIIHVVTLFIHFVICHNLTLIPWQRLFVYKVR